MGHGIYYICSNCGYDSGTLAVGYGMLGVLQAPVACSRCRRVITSAVDPRPDSLGPGPAPPAAEVGDVIDQACPGCGGPAVLLADEGSSLEAAERVCPACGEHHLTGSEGFLLWD